MTETNIIQFDSYKTGTDNVTQLVAQIKDETEEKSYETAPPMDTASIYSNAGAVTSHISRALVLLEEGKVYLSNAIAASSNNDEIDSDNEVQHFYALLPELFCCRDIGDGFGAIINAIYNAITNQLDSDILTLGQLNKISQLVIRLQSEPFLEIDQAIELIIELEDTDLNIKPQHLEQITGILSGE